MPITIATTVKTYPRLPYEAMATAVLGSRYQVNLTFVGEDRARKLNRTYRHKTYAPDVLSFPLTDDAGEIYITPKVAARAARKFDSTPTDHIGFLFIHGLLHLKGLDHGSAMEKLEKKYRAQFKLR